MSEVLDCAREVDPKFKDVPDGELVRFIADTKPEFMQDPGFRAQYYNTVKPASLQTAYEVPSVGRPSTAAAPAQEPAPSGAGVAVAPHLEVARAQARGRAETEGVGLLDPMGPSAIELAGRSHARAHDAPSSGQPSIITRILEGPARFCAVLREPDAHGVPCPSRARAFGTGST